MDCGEPDISLNMGSDRMTRKIVIVTPGAIGSNPRVVKEADALQSIGYAVLVVSTRTLDHVDARDESLLRRVEWQSDRIDLRSTLAWRSKRLSQLAVRSAFSLKPHPVLVSRAFSPYTQSLTRAVMRAPADLYIAHYPAALPAAFAAARAHGARYAYDAEDFHLGDWPATPEYELDRALVRAIEGRHLSGCAFVTAASPGIADAYVDAYGITRPTVVLNTFPLAQAPLGPSAKGSATPGLSLYWFSQTIGPNRGLECAVEAISRAISRPHLYLRGTLAKGFGERLDGLARQYGVLERIHIMAPAPPDELERLAAFYDIGLVSETGETTARQVCLTNKLFSFLLAGIPTLMSDTPAHKAFAAEAGLQGQIYRSGDAQGLAMLIDDFFHRPERLAVARMKAWTLAQERYNWDQDRGVIQRIVAAQTSHNGRAEVD